MSDHFLKFSDEATADAALTAAGLTGGHGPGWAVDRVGTIRGEPPLDGNGDPTGPGAEVAGWHVNIRLLDAALPDALAAFEVFPVTPNRRFA